MSSEAAHTIRTVALALLVSILLGTLAALPHISTGKRRVSGAPFISLSQVHSRSQHVSSRQQMLADLEEDERGTGEEGVRENDDEGLDDLGGDWHTPMWRGGVDEGQPVLTATLGKRAGMVGFPADEFALFSTEEANSTAANATDGEGDEGGEAAAAGQGGPPEEGAAGETAGEEGGEAASEKSPQPEQPTLCWFWCGEVSEADLKAPSEPFYAQDVPHVPAAQSEGAGQGQRMEGQRIGLASADRKSVV